MSLAKIRMPREPYDWDFVCSCVLLFLARLTMSDAVDRLFLCQLKCHVAWPALSLPYNRTSGACDLFNKHWVSSVWGVKRPGRESDHSRPSSTDADRTELYFFSFYKLIP
jgi:hypothetical protein